MPVNRYTGLAVMLCSIIYQSAPDVPRAFAGGKGQIVREVVETVAGGGVRSVPKLTKAVSSQVDDLVARFGTDVTTATRKVGPEAVAKIAKADHSHTGQCIKLVARRGDEGLWVVSRPNRLAIFIRHGDDAATAMIRHREIVIPLIDRFGGPAARALGKLKPRNARRLVMLHNSGTLARTSRAEEVFEVIGKYGDRGMEFIWKHKGALAGGAVLGLFLANPEPFLDGSRQLGEVAIGSVIAPVARTAAEALNWNAFAPIGCTILAAIAWRRGLFGRRRAKHAG